MVEEFWVGPDTEGNIINWSETAPAMLKYSRGLRGRSLLIMLVAGRPDPSALTRVVWGESVRGTAQLRPLERKILNVDYCIERLDSTAKDQPVLLWTFCGTDPIPSGSPRFGASVLLDLPPIGSGHWGTQYDVSPDGRGSISSIGDSSRRRPFGVVVAPARAKPW